MKTIVGAVEQDIRKRTRAGARRWFAAGLSSGRPMSLVMLPRPSHSFCLNRVRTWHLLFASRLDARRARDPDGARRGRARVFSSCSSNPGAGHGRSARALLLARAT